MVKRRCSVKNCKVNSQDKDAYLYNVKGCSNYSDIKKYLRENKEQKICQNHFENKWFTAKKRLKRCSIPTIFKTETDPTYNISTDHNYNNNSTLQTDYNLAVKQVAQLKNKLQIVRTHKRKLISKVRCLEEKLGKHFLMTVK